MAKKEEKYEVLIEVSASQIKKMKEMADTILKNQGIEPEIYWYERYYEFVMNNVTQLQKP